MSISSSSSSCKHHTHRDTLSATVTRKDGAQRMGCLRSAVCVVIARCWATWNVLQREREREMRWMAGNTRPELSSNAAAAAVAGEVMNVWPGKENRREKGRKANPADQKATATTSTIIEKKDH